jgi:hypothetical protein
MKPCAIRLLVVLSLLAASSAAAEWIKMGGNDSVDAYMDLKLLEKKGKYAVSWRLYDYKSPQKSSAGKTYRSAITLDVTDCSGRTEAMTSFTQYDRPMGKGNVVASRTLAQSEWEVSKITPNSIGEALAMVACGRFKMWQEK